MSTVDGVVRRQRILQARDDRLALITGRLPNLPSLPPPPQSLSPDADHASKPQSPPLVSRNCAPEPRPSRRPQDERDAAQSNQNGAIASVSREEYFKLTDGSRSVSCSEQLMLVTLNLFSPISSNQLGFVLAATEQLRMMLSITMALLVLMSHFGFFVFGFNIVRSIILFRPLILLLLMNIALIVARILPEMKGQQKGDPKLTVLDGFGWVEEASRAVEVGLMVHDVLKTLFMDFIVYCSIIICGFCLAC